MPAPPDVMTTLDAARYLQLSVRTLETWRRLRQGPPFVRIHRAVRYRKADLNAWLDQQQVSQGQRPTPNVLADRSRSTEADDQDDPADTLDEMITATARRLSQQETTR